MEQWKRNLYILWGASFLLMAAMTSIMPFLPLHIEQNMGITSKEEAAMWAGIIFSANFFTAFLVSPFWGKVADRYGRKPMLLRAGFGMAIVISLMGLATNVYQLLILRLLNGLIAGFNPAATALVATNTPKEKVGYSLGVLQSGSVAGSIIGPLLGGFLGDYVGFRAIFVYTGVLILLAALIVLIFVKEDFKPQDKTVKKTKIGYDLKLIYSTQPLTALFIAAFMMQFATAIVFPVLPLYVGELNPPDGRISFFAGLVAATTGIANVLFAPKLGKLGDKYGSEKILFYSLIGAAVFFIPQGFVSNVWELMFWRLLLGVTIGGLLPSLNSLIRRFSPVGMESMIFGYSNSAIMLGNMLGPLLGGTLAGIVGIRNTFVLTGVLLFINGVWVRGKVYKSINNLERAAH